MSRNRSVTPVDSLLADPLDQPLDRLRGDVQIGEFGQVARRLLIRGAVDTGVNDLLLDAGTEARAVKAQRLVLRTGAAIQVASASAFPLVRRRSIT